MIHLVRKMVMVGLGMGARGLDQLDQWAKEGEQSQTECAKAARTFLSDLEKNSKKLEQKGRHLAEGLLERMPIPTRSDFERLEKKIQELSARMERGGKA